MKTYSSAMKLHRMIRVEYGGWLRYFRRQGLVHGVRWLVSR